MLLKDGRPIADFSQPKRRVILSDDFLWSFKGSVFCVPSGYISDGASIPSCLFWWQWGISHQAAVLHDFALDYGWLLINGKNASVSKDEAHIIFHDCLVDLGCDRITAALMFYAVVLYHWLQK